MQITAVVAVSALAGCGAGQGDGPRSRVTTAPATNAPQSLRGTNSRYVQGTTDRVPRQVTQTCRRAAAKVVVDVLCPKIVPQGPVERALGYGAIIRSGERRFYELTFNNASGSHWVVGRGGRREVARFVSRSKGRARLLRRDTVDGRVISTYLFAGYPAGGLHGDHVAVFTSYRGSIVFASVHGRNKRHIALAVLRSMLSTR